jgi:F1F0 ATPase subunit 2
MNDLLSLAAALAAGILLGALFFGGLWWTVRLGLSSQRPALWFLGSLLARMSLALVGFYFVGGEQWPRWLLCLLGFILSRFVVQHGWRAWQASDAT